MGKYEALAKYLSSLKGKNEVSLKFAEVEDILGFQLPRSASIYRPWWANDKTHTQAIDGWLNVGWTVKSVDLERKIVVFERSGEPKLLEKRKEAIGRFNHRDFEGFTREVMSEFLGVELAPRGRPDWPKLFDLVSPDYSIVGDAKFLSMVRGRSIPPAKFATIAEHVWFLEKIDAKMKFLIFGNDRRVPLEWLKRYGSLVRDVKFYFLDERGNLSELKL
ncbi:MAG: DUF7662 domain-containing protein [Candidatus Njordarchaeales archaeon]